MADRDLYHRASPNAAPAVMRDYKNTTRAQTDFLRAVAKNPYGLPPDQWPSPDILRRWLKRPGFCDATESILRDGNADDGEAGDGDDDDKDRR
jgi:hypothetical protein